MKSKIDKNGNMYTFVYATVLVLVVATLLALCATWLKPFQKQNIDSESKSQILSSAGITAPKQQNYLEFAQEAFDKYVVERFAVNTKGEIVEGVDAFKVDLKAEQEKEEDNQVLPIFKVLTNSAETKYIIPVRGKGLWGAIWGYIALNDDFSTIYGVKFDHKSETPGLGAEIATAHFQDQFKGKTIFDGSKKFVSISVIKGDAKNQEHAVDAISGATITSNGVQEMIFDCLRLYQPYITKTKAEQEAKEQAALRAAFVADSIKEAQIAAQNEAREKAERAYLRKQRAIRDSIAAQQPQNTTTPTNN